MLKKAFLLFWNFPDRFAERFSGPVAKFNLWLEKRDTVYIEAFLACYMIINAVLVSTFNRYGDSMAPFLNSAISYLVIDRVWWIALLSLVGLGKGIALIHGQMHGNGYKWRARLALLASFLWGVVASAVMSGPEPRVIACIYFLTWSGSMAVYVTLIRKHHKAKRDLQDSKKLDLMLKNESPICQSIAGKELRFDAHLRLYS